MDGASATLSAKSQQGDADSALNATGADALSGTTAYITNSTISAGNDVSLRAKEWIDFDVIVGINLLREGLDIPEVKLVAILDADKEGFLRSHRSLTQTIGRAARNINGKAIMYADKITRSMQLTIDATNGRREKQIEYNTEHNITPKQIQKSIDSSLTKNNISSFHYNNAAALAAEQDLEYLPKPEIEKRIRDNQKLMEQAAKALDFIAAAQIRDQIKVLKEQL